MCREPFLTRMINFFDRQKDFFFKFTRVIHGHNFELAGSSTPSVLQSTGVRSSRYVISDFQVPITRVAVDIGTLGLEAFL